MNYKLYSNAVFWKEGVNRSFWWYSRTIWNRWNIWSTWRNNKHPIITLTFTMRGDCFYIFICDIVMGFFSFERIQILNSTWFSCCEDKLDFWIEKTKELFIFGFHIIINLKMHSYEPFLIMLYHSRKKMLEGWKILSMHSNKEGALFSLKRNINNIIGLRDLNIRKRNRETIKEGFNDLFGHKSSIKISDDYSKKVEKRNFYSCLFSEICKRIFFS